MELETKQTEQDIDDSIQKRAPTIGIRHLQSLLLFLCVVTGYLLRVNLSVTIMAMDPVVNSTDYFNERTQHVPIFEWSEQTRSSLLSSFFVGYLLANFPASILGCQYDQKLLLAISMVTTSVLALISPWAVETFGAPALVVVRFAQGLFSAFMFPMIHGIMARWAPPHERGRLVGFVGSGIQLGTMITLAMSGYISSNYKLGWPTVYYLSGAAGLAWTTMWMLLGASTLSSHRFVSHAERDYIQASLANTVEHDVKLSDTPWRSIFTSLPVWATTIAHTGHNWGFWLLLTEMPTFIHMVLKVNLTEDGALSALPYLAMFLLQVPVLYTADLLNKRHVTTLTTSRKIWNSVSMWGAAAGLLGLGCMRHHTVVTSITLYVVIVAIGCTTNAGFNINHIDLSANYAGLLMGITNTVASTGGIVAPLLVGFIIDDPTSVDQWRTIFISGAVVLFMCNLFFVLCGSAETQPWNSLCNVAPKANKTKQEFDIIA